MSQCTRFHRATRCLASRVREERGQSLVEFAIVLPVLLMIILGIIYFGRYEGYNNQVTQLAEQGARWAAVGFEPAGATTLQQYVQAQAQPELQSGSSDVTGPARVYIYSPSGATYQVGQPIRVCVVASVTFPTLVTTVTPVLAQTATMRIEQIPSGWTSTATTYYNSSNPALSPYRAGSPDTAIPANCSQS